MNKYEKILIELSKKAYKKNEVPVAAILINNEGKIIAKATNTREKSNFFYDHAEIKCLILANKCLKSKFLTECSLYVTLEPCEMCKVFIRECRIKNVYYMVDRDPIKRSYYKTNFENWNCSLESKKIYQNLLAKFFKKRR